MAEYNYTCGDCLFVHVCEGNSSLRSFNKKNTAYCKAFKNAADVVEASVLKDFAKDVVYQFGYKVNRDNGRLYLTTGGLSTLETAFDILDWEDPRPFPEGECEWDGCYNYATCGIPTPDGYKHVCYKHLCFNFAKMDGERRASDG